MKEVRENGHFALNCFVLNSHDSVVDTCLFVFYNSGNINSADLWHTFPL